MSKIKTIRSVYKRFKKNSSGLVKHKRSNLRHLLLKKNSKRKRHLRRKAIVLRCDLVHILPCLPYV
ncbi:50S ribosomal protein L35 [Candidatus Purcelliella pentastirinorum]|uniref:Large ribosomal subunit protein bL35 n=1 Tax=Candidatus Purcelliella pentastirinorum TaxID=472834 RepID=A0AAX3N741_9ENTR|nr:50S ribosomal protein L35 [Candidatus Purcelliella pentastirinorum]WDI78406.1 50S ribosomal protein L35 [Candidatus Purcelliella pentastirinorum]WDR80566.1 50S ribosomal protein L35 [Candidatus Purcelliella pentastirinorum]